jgi:O-antigen/teichoic acid export membrane protein
VTPRGAGRRLVGDILLAMFRHLASLAAGLITLPLVARALGPEGVGAWALLGTSAFVIGAADLGLGVVVQRAVVRGDQEASARAVGLALWVVATVAPVLVLGVWLTLDGLPHAREELRRDLSAAARIALAGGLVAAFAVPYRAVLLARGAGAALARARTAASTAQVGLTAVGLALAPTLLAPAVALSGSLVLETVWLALAARRLLPGLPLRPAGRPSFTELTSGLRDGAATVAMNLAGLLALRLDVMVLAQFVPLATVGAYAVASRAVDQSFTLAKQASTALLPRLGDPAERGSAVQLGTAVLGGLVVSGMTALVLDGTPLLVAWAGPVAARPEASNALVLLASAAVVSSVHEVVASSLTLGARTPWSAAGPILAGHLLNAAITLGGARDLGVWAVAGGNLAGALLSCMLLWRGALGLLGWRRAAAARALAPVGAALALSAAVGLALHARGAGGVWGSVAACALTTATGFVGAMFVAWIPRSRFSARVTP